MNKNIHDITKRPIIEWIQKQISITDYGSAEKEQQERVEKFESEIDSNLDKLLDLLSSLKEKASKINNLFSEAFKHIKTDNGETFEDYKKAKELIGESVIDPYEVVYHSIVDNKVYIKLNKKSYDSECNIKGSEVSECQYSNLDEALKNSSTVDVFKLVFLYVIEYALYLVLKVLLSLAKWPISGLVMSVAAPLIKVFYILKEKLPFDIGLELNVPDRVFQECRYKVPIKGWISVPVPVYLQKKCWDKREYKWDDEKEDIVPLEESDLIKGMETEFNDMLYNTFHYGPPARCRQRALGIISRFKNKVNGELDNEAYSAGLSLYDIFRFGEKLLGHSEKALDPIAKGYSPKNRLGGYSTSTDHLIAADFYELMKRLDNLFNKIEKTLHYLMKDKAVACCLIRNLLSSMLATHGQYPSKEAINKLRNTLRSVRLIVRGVINLEKMTMNISLPNLTEILQEFLLAVVAALVSALTVVLQAVKASDPFIKLLYRMKFTKNDQISRVLRECLAWNNFVSWIIDAYSHMYDTITKLARDALVWVLSKMKIADKSADMIIKIIKLTYLSDILQKLDKLLGLVYLDPALSNIEFLINCIDTDTLKDIKEAGQMSALTDGDDVDRYKELTDEELKQYIDEKAKTEPIVSTLKEAGFSDEEIVSMFNRDPRTGAVVSKESIDYNIDDILDVFGECGASASVEEYRKLMEE